MFELILVSCDCMDLNQSNTQLKAPSTCIRIYLKTLNENATFQKNSTWRNFIDVVFQFSGGRIKTEIFLKGQYISN